MFQQQQQIMQGTLYVSPLSAQLTHDTDFFSKMDPFCLFIQGQFKHRTATCKNGGKTPKWSSQQVSFNCSSADKAYVEIWDDDTFGSNKLIAVGEIPVGQLAMSGQKQTTTVSLMYKQKPAGSLTIEGWFQANQQQQQFNQQNQQQQQFNQQQQQFNQ